MFSCLRVLEFKAIPWTDMDAEIAPRTELFVDHSDGAVRRATDELAYFAELVSDCLNRADHPARAAVNTNVWIDDVQHVPVPGDRVNRTIG